MTGEFDDLDEQITNLAAPTDHGSDRFGYVEGINIPEAVTVKDEWIAEWLMECPSCTPNVFVRWIGPAAPLTWSQADFHVTFAHDAACTNPEIVDA